MAFLKQPSQCSGSLSAGSHTPLTPLVYCLARIGVFMFQLIQALYPVPVSLQHRHVPRTPLPAKGVTSLQRDVLHHVGRRYPSFIAHTGSCAKPNSSRRLRLAITAGLCRLLPVPAGRWPFPTLSLQSLRRRLDPYPAVSFRCACSLLPERQRPHIQRHTFGTLKIHLQCNFNRNSFSGLQSFTNVQAPTLVSPPGCTYR
jgi:hypothetical protein